MTVITIFLDKNQLVDRDAFVDQGSDALLMRRRRRPSNQCRLQINADGGAPALFPSLFSFYGTVGLF